VGFAHMSSGLCPDDGRFATTSWRQSRHDVGFAHMSSGLCPDDQKLLVFLKFFHTKLQILSSKMIFDETKKSELE
jgi:hypothetical protein